MASRSSTHLPTTIEPIGLQAFHPSQVQQTTQEVQAQTQSNGANHNHQVAHATHKQLTNGDSSQPSNKKRKFSICQEEFSGVTSVSSTDTKTTAINTTTPVPGPTSIPTTATLTGSPPNGKEYQQSIRKLSSPGQEQQQHQQQSTDKMVIERLQSQCNELANERTKMREGIIMATFKQRIKEDEWKEKERQYNSAIDKLTTRIQSLELQLSTSLKQQQHQHHHHQPQHLQSMPTMISSSSSSALSSLANRRHSTPPKLICAQPDVIIGHSASSSSAASTTQDPFRRNSISSFNSSSVKNNGNGKSDEREMKLPRIQNLLNEGRRSSLSMHDDSSQGQQQQPQSPSKIHLPPASSLLAEDISGLYMVDELKQILQQKEMTIEQQKLTIQRMDEEISHLKKYIATSSSPVAMHHPSSTAAAIATSSHIAPTVTSAVTGGGGGTSVSSSSSQRQSRPVRAGNKLGKRYDFPKEATIILKQWMIAHTANPYPSKEEKDDLAHKTGLTVTQLNDWMTNYRRRNIRKHSSASTGTLTSGSVAPSTTAPAHESSAVAVHNKSSHNHHYSSSPMYNSPPASHS